MAEEEISSKSKEAEDNWKLLQEVNIKLKDMRHR